MQAKHSTTNQKILINKMLQKRIDPLLIWAVKDYYESLIAVVQNGIEWSTIFLTTIGVKQDGVISVDL